MVNFFLILTITFDLLFHRKQLQLEFLDHGVLNLLKSWLEPLPDGSLPNINIRTAILKILNDVMSSYHYDDLDAIIFY